MNHWFVVWFCVDVLLKFQTKTSSFEHFLIKKMEISDFLDYKRKLQQIKT